MPRPTFLRGGVRAGLGAIAVLCLLAPAPPANAAPAPGYWLLAGDGGLFTFHAPFFGSAASDPARCAPNTTDRSLPNGRCFAIAATPDGGGYWILDGDRGHIYRFGNAGSYGEPATAFVNTPREFVPSGRAIVSTPSGHGYWVLELNLSGAATIDHFGDAGAFGDSQMLVAKKHIAPNGIPVGMAAKPNGTGYWEVHSDGGVFAFGKAKFFGSLGGMTLASPIVGMAATNTGNGYWLASADGHVYPFGDAPHTSSLAGKPLAQPIVGIATNRRGSGFWLVARDGGVFTFGGAPFRGSLGGKPLNQPIFGIAAR